MENQISVGVIPTKVIPFVWTDVKQLITQHSGGLDAMMSLGAVERNLLENNLDLWLGTDGNELEMGMLCGWEKHEFVAHYHLIWVGGENLSKYLKLGLEKLEQYACLCGAKELVMAGRDGWERKLKPFGFVPKQRLVKNVQVLWRN